MEDLFAAAVPLRRIGSNGRHLRCNAGQYLEWTDGTDPSGGG